MKKSISVLIILVLVLSLGSCNILKESKSTEENALEFYTEEDFPVSNKEEQEIIDRYLMPYFITGLSYVDFSEDDISKLDGNLLMTMFDALSHTLNTPTEEEKSNYNGELPEEVVEKVLTAHFTLSAEEIREACKDIYNIDEKTYKYQGGIGGGPAAYIITKHSKDGNILSFSYKFFTGDLGEDEEFIYVLTRTGEMTIKVSDNAEDFVFLSNKTY